MCFEVYLEHHIFPFQNIEAEQRSLLHRPLDLLFVIYLIPAFAFCVFRGLVTTTIYNIHLYTHHLLLLFKLFVV